MFIEIKAIRAIGALHRGVVNLAIRTLSARDRAAYKRFNAQHDYADSLNRLADKTAQKADEVRVVASEELSKKTRDINAALNTVQNLSDDLTKI